MSFQKTIRQAVSFEGIGLHSGNLVRMDVKPSRPNSGIRFVRMDVLGEPEVAAHFKNVSSTQMATVLGRGEASVGTVEHLMAALYGAGIDNATIEVSGNEVPVMDGSSTQFYERFKQVGTQTQLQPRAFALIKRRVEVKAAEKWAVVEPSMDFSVQASVDFDHPSIGYQNYRFVEREGAFDDLAHARTFGFVKEVEALKRLGLARGGSLENAVVMDEVKVLNPEGVRCHDEFVKHKVLDALGDFKLAGLSLRGSFLLHRAGHELHWKLLQAIFRDADNYEIVDSNQLQKGIAGNAVGKVRAAIARLVASV